MKGRGDVLNCRLIGWTGSLKERHLLPRTASASVPARRDRLTGGLNRCFLIKVNGDAPSGHIFRWCLTGQGTGRGGGTDMFRTRQSTLDEHLPFLGGQWTGGCRNGAELWHRVKRQGFKGSLRVVTEWATRRRRAEKISNQQLQKEVPLPGR